MLEQIGRVRRHALPEQQSRRNQTIKRRIEFCFWLGYHGSQQHVRELAPVSCPTCATSLAGPSRSSRAIRGACRLAGTPSAGDGTTPIAFSAAPPLSASSTAFVISSTNRGT